MLNLLTFLEWPYRVDPEKRAVLQQEVEYMLKNDLIERSHSALCSPCILVSKADSLSEEQERADAILGNGWLLSPFL